VSNSGFTSLQYVRISNGLAIFRNDVAKDKEKAFDEN
jgi:hypothetical protein